MLNILRNWKQIQQNPIYLREKGHWGEPNPYYQNVRRYMPFVIIGVAVLGICCGANTISTIFGVTTQQSTFAILACLPNFVVQMISWVAVILVPALTAPMVVEETRMGTWEILRLTPFSTEEIFVAKLLGGLSRLKIWIPLIVLNAFQLLAVTLGFFLDANLFNLDLEVLIPLLNPLLILRPWVEIVWIAMVGLVASTWMDTGRGALVATYITVLGFRLLNGWLIWVMIALFGEFLLSSTVISTLIVTFGPFFGYIALMFITYRILIRRARYLDRNFIVPGN